MNVLTTVHAYSEIFYNGQISSNIIRTREYVNNWEHTCLVPSLDKRKIKNILMLKS